jgi:hypothetical protein
LRFQQGSRHQGIHSPADGDGYQRLHSKKV